MSAKKELLAEAKRRYPIGTKYKSLGVGNPEYTVEDNVVPYFHSESKIALSFGTGLVYDIVNDIWAEIIRPIYEIY